MNLFGNATLRSTDRGAPDAGDGSGLRNLFSVLMQMQGDAAPPVRKDVAVPEFNGSAGAVDAMMNGPETAKQGPDIPAPENKPGWMFSPSAITAAPYTGGLSMASGSPVIQDAPMSGYIEPATKWDGSPRDNWITKSATSYVAKDLPHLESMLLQSKDPVEFNRIVGANSDWSKYKRVQQVVKAAGNAAKETWDFQRNVDRDTSTFNHQQKMEELAQETRHIQAAAAQGVTTLNKTFATDWNSAIQNATDEERAQITALSDPEKFPPVQLPGGILMPNSESRAALAAIKSQQTKRMAEEAGLVPTAIKNGQPVYGVPKPEVDAAGGDPIVQVEPDGTRIIYRPNSKALHVESPDGKKRELTPFQEFTMGQKLIAMEGAEFQAAGTNYIRKAIAAGYKPTTVGSAPKTAAPPPAETPTKLSPSNITSEFETWLKSQK